MKRKLIGLILSAVMAVSLVGCGGAGDDGTTAGTSTDTPTKSESDNVDTPASAPSDDAQSLTVWCWDSFNVDAMKKAGEIYTADHPDVTINVQETVSSDIQTLIQTYAMSGELNALPDIFLMDDQVFAKYLQNYPDVFADITDSGIPFQDFADVICCEL